MSEEKEYPFSTAFSIPSEEGVLDIGIRYNTKTGQYCYRTEEQGLPVSVPAHVWTGILQLMILAGVGDTQKYST